MKLILLGPPAAGKGTQAEAIAEKYALAHISTGDMLRAEIALQTNRGMQAKAIIDKGNLVPDEMICAMVEERISHEDCRNGFILDGFPRTLAQAEAISSMTDIDAVLDIDAEPDSSCCKAQGLPGVQAHAGSRGGRRARLRKMRCKAHQTPGR